jgi:transcriptional regulator with XRE-family HTH domain
MNLLAQATLRSKKIGVLIRGARQASRKTLPECARAVGTTAGIVLSWEEGRRAPSLPELELLAYFLGYPLTDFWSNTLSTGGPAARAGLDANAFLAIRERFIGALLRQDREKAGYSLQKMSELSGISTGRLRSFELGESPIPLPVLEGLMNLLGGSLDTLFDQKGPVGLWMAQQDAVAGFLELPQEIREFVAKQVNRPYLELALKLSGMSSAKLRAVAENILDITY